MTSLHETMQQLGQNAKKAANQMLRANDAQKSAALLHLAHLIETQQDALKQANQRDLDKAQQNGLAPALLNRLTLNDKALHTMVQGLKQIASMPDPVGCLSPTQVRPNGMRVAQMRVPLGVIGIIYESRPNVTIDAAALCLKAGNACILRGGSEAFHSNQALAQLIAQSLEHAQLPAHAVQVIKTTDREAVGELIQMTQWVDVIIPRGGKSLLTRLAEQARVPMIMHLSGNCHMYIDEFADPAMGIDLAFHAKTYRYGICGALETLLVHQSMAQPVLVPLGKRFEAQGVTLRACPRAMSYLPKAEPATAEDWETEYLGPTLAVKVVDSLEEAIAHIQQYSSGHTESIITQNITHADQFQRWVDSSSVYVNLPTVFADGFEYGLGAEIGISTNRLHARGPVGLEGLTTYKWVLQGNGQKRQ